MLDFLSKLFDTEAFPPRWYCGTWTSGHGWLHICSDAATFAAYMTIPFVLVYFLRKRPDLPFPRVFYWFAVFIFVCGTVHLLEAVIFWWPIYRAAGVVKLITALVSWGTVISIVLAAPRALTIRTPEELEKEILVREKVEEELRRSEQRLSMAVQATDDAIWDYDVLQKSFWWNDMLVEMSGLTPSPKEDIQKWREQHVHPEDRDRVRDSFNAALHSDANYGGRWTEAYRFGPSQGPYLHIVDRALIARDVDGLPTRFLGAMIDVTEMKESEEKLVQSERLSAIGEAMTGLVHESRNALARSQAGLKLLTRQIGKQPELLRYIDESLGAQKDVQRLFEEVREYAVPPKLDFTLSAIPELVDNVCENLNRIEDNTAIGLRQEHDGVQVECLVDTFSISNVFRNLLENSAAAGNETPKVVISYQNRVIKGDETLEITYSDNGSGLSDEQAKLIFDPFYTTKTNGTGLGMAISKRSIEQHQGTIVVEQDQPGAKFIITLPARCK